MTDPLQPLVDDLLEWIATPRPYTEVMEAWRTSCPRLPVWEEANRLGLVQCDRDAAGVEQVALTSQGRERLRARRAVTPSPSGGGLGWGRSRPNPRTAPDQTPERPHPHPPPEGEGA